jgi:hypothetical protein
MKQRQCEVRVSANDKLWQWQGRPLWIGSAEVRVEMGNGQTMQYFCEFGGNPFNSRDEAEKFAYQAALDRVLGKTVRLQDEAHPP